MMAGVSIQLLLVAYILIVFGLLEGTKRTIRSIDEAWQVFAQVALLQNEIALDNEKDGDKAGWTTATDLEVEKSLKRRGLKDKIFVLDDKDESGFVRFSAEEESHP
jgi:type II secretory pathway component PulM